MIDRTWIAVLIGLLAAAWGLQCPKQTTSPGREVVCYTSASDVEELSEAICKCTTLVQQGHDLRNVSTSDFNDFQKSLKEIIPPLQFMISIDDPGKLLRTSGAVRQEITARLIAVLKEVDGVELNATAGSKERLLHFVKGLKDELLRKSYEKRIFLVLPTKSEDLAKQFDLKELSKYVDLFAVPTHYLVEDDETHRTFHPSRLMGLFDMFNADSLIDLISGLGAPKRKILMSLPASVYRFTLEDQDDNAPRAPTVDTQPVTIDQKQLCDLMKKEGWTVERDEDLTAPYAFKEKMWIAFEDRISVAIKGKYVLLRDLPGLAVHDVQNDLKTECSKPLTHEIHRSFSSFKRKSRAAVLNALEDELHQTQLEYPTKVKSSNFRVVRVVDTEGHIRAVRENTQIEFTCSRQGYFVHPKSCNRFYRCVKFNQEVEDYSVFEFDCPAGLSFDERTEVCVWPGSMPEGSPCPGSSEIAPVARVRFECPSKPGYYADPQNPRWFFACIDLGGPELMAYEFRCPFGLIFDEQKLICEWPWLVAGYSVSGYTSSGYGTGSTVGTGGYYTGGLPHGYSGTAGRGYSGSTIGSGFSGPAGVGYADGQGSTGYTQSVAGGVGSSYSGSGYSGSTVAGGHAGPGSGYTGTVGGGHSATVGPSIQGSTGYFGAGVGGRGSSDGGQGAGGYSGTTASGYSGAGRGSSFGGQVSGGYSGTTGTGYSGAGRGSSFGGQGAGGYSGTTASGYSGAGRGSSFGGQTSGGYSGTTGTGYSGAGRGSSIGGQVSGGYSGADRGYSGQVSGGYSGTTASGYSGTGSTAGHGVSFDQGTRTTSSGYSGSVTSQTGAGHGVGTHDGSTGTVGSPGYSGGAVYTGASDYGSTSGVYTGSKGKEYSGATGAGQISTGYAGTGAAGQSGTTGTYRVTSGTGYKGTDHGYSGQDFTGYDSGSKYSGSTSGGYTGTGGAHVGGSTVGGGYTGTGGAHVGGSTVGEGYTGTVGTHVGGSTVGGGYTGAGGAHVGGSTVGEGYTGTGGAHIGGSTVGGGYTGAGGAHVGGSTVGEGYTGTGGAHVGGSTIGGGYTGTVGTHVGGSTVGGGYTGAGGAHVGGSTVGEGYTGTGGAHVGGSTIEGGYTGAGGAHVGGGYTGTVGTHVGGSTVGGYTGAGGAHVGGGYTGAGGAHVGGGYTGTVGTHVGGSTVGGYTDTSGVHVGGSTVGGGYTKTGGAHVGGYTETGGAHVGTTAGGYAGTSGAHVGTTAGGYAGTSGTHIGSTAGGFTGTSGTHVGGYTGTSGTHIGGSTAGGYTETGGAHVGTTAGGYAGTTGAGGYSGPGTIYGGPTGTSFAGSTIGTAGGSHTISTGVQYSGSTGAGGYTQGTSIKSGVKGAYPGSIGSQYPGSSTPGPSIGVVTGHGYPEQTGTSPSGIGGQTGSLLPGQTIKFGTQPSQTPIYVSSGTIGSGPGSTDITSIHGQTPGTIIVGKPGQPLCVTNCYGGTPGLTSGTNVYEGLNITGYTVSPGVTSYPKGAVPTGYGVTIRPGVIATGQDVQGSITTGSSSPGTLITYGGTSGTVLAGSSGQAGIVTGAGRPGYTKTGAGTPGYVISDGVKTVYPGSASPGTVIYGQPTPGVVVTGPPTAGTVIKGQTSPGVVLTGQTAPGASIGGSIGQGTIVGSTGRGTGYPSQQGGVTTASPYGTKIGTVPSLYDMGYKTNEYHDNGGRGTIRFNNGGVTTKYTENDIPDYRPTGGTIPPGTFVSGVSTPSGFTKTGPTKTGFTTASLGGGGGYVISTGRPRPTPSPENIGAKAFEGNVVGYTKSSTEIDDDGYSGVTSSYDSGASGPTKTTGYSYVTPSVPFETGVTTESPISSTISQTGPTPFLTVEVHNTPGVGGFTSITGLPGDSSVYKTSPGFARVPTVAPGVYSSTGRFETDFGAPKIPFSGSTARPAIITGSVGSSTPVTLTQDTYGGGVQTESQFGYGTRTSQQRGYTATYQPSTFVSTTPQYYYESTTASPGLPGKTVFGHVTPGVSESLKPQTQYLPGGQTYKPIIYQQSTPIPSGIGKPYTIESTTVGGGSPTNVEIPRDEVGKLITNYNRGSTKYVPNQYDIYSTGADYSRTQSSSSSTFRQGYVSTTPASAGRTPSSLAVTTYSGGYSKPSSIITYQTTAKTTAVGKGKVIVKWSDLHPLLLGKLGAECTCRGDPFANLRGPGSKLIDSSKGKVDLSNYDESDIYVDLEKDDSNENEDYVTNQQSSSVGPVKIWNEELSSSKYQVEEKPSNTYLPSSTAATSYRSGKSLRNVESSTAANASDEGFSLSRSDKDDLEETIDGATNCARPGLFRHPNFCNKFYGCHWDEHKKKFTLHVFSCPVHLTFDNGASACNWPSMGPACQDNNLLV
ncbi:unnamed protein product [Xylocopa violacea]|uniref:Chitin-binding type-2 domain-containing protein n=1 Tax=Xylocopa violacea TaxID=135666 RepID=A0ABP1MY80_XYLVO